MSKSQRSRTKAKSSASKPSSILAILNKGNWQYISLAALALIIVTLILIRFNSPKQPADFQIEVTVAEAYEKYQEGVFFLDVRTPEEWADYHIPNTTLIPLDELESRLDELPRDQEIVVVCRSGNRSQEGRDILLSARLLPTSSMVGGINEWRSAGYPIVTGP